MCQIFANQPAETYQYITRSIRIDGHVTSVKLEASFWTILEEIAAHQAMSMPKFLSRIHQEALALNGDVTNFASMLRCACLIYLRQPSQTIKTAQAELCDSL
ncbi:MULTISPECIES: ribbon-helix-helix domain-containing protein [Vibrio]|uniref:Ribbon-helix-helix domain-containing protein n=1 Tax=Vibrio proteolyticus NBRC 13287 TaxID=1219065 RepID=U3B7X1_VIBPR|nr:MULTISPECIES: ribbon-helix-helix domain-containing protein [Vibrio]NAW58264.1 DNA-binding protein [Vibrio sp. V36_P2S2PM302]NAX21551.1 DNA-binding protein [Vibrio sp. V39_P1S14PM300]NAX24013.1 DNA-binding protein [Vibrio sp. V38_P2S17PM301]NAX31539.1 DNA-binding protein [Vibrio sp. V37_P2S8PM304]GAD65944.1 hypothetical protein VPR01S_02_01950 [Vibrio proteolyticus NBRC 13287]